MSETARPANMILQHRKDVEAIRESPHCMDGMVNYGGP